VGLSANVWVEVVGLLMIVLDFVNAFGLVPLHVLKPAMRINVSINMLFDIAAYYSRESVPAMPFTSGATRLSILFRARNVAGKVSQCGWVLRIYNPASAMLLRPVVLQGEGRARTDYKNNGKSPVGLPLLSDLYLV
jgi:hypothetical protein